MGEHSENALTNLSEADHKTWHRILDTINRAMTEEFGEDEERTPFIVIGAQFGDLGQDDYAPCVVSSNMPVCVIPEAVADMLRVAEEEHRLAHEARAAGIPITETMQAENVPEEVRAIAAQFAEQLGIDVSQVQFIQVADADLSDLNSLAETDEPVRASTDMVPDSFWHNLPDENDDMGSEGAPPKGEVIDGNG